jgi:phosphotransacetylase
MKKILCFGNVSDKYKNAITNTMKECQNIAGWEYAPDNDVLPGSDDEIVLMKCNIHTDDFLRRVIAINKNLNNGEKFYLTHCFILFNKSGNRAPFILTDAACVPTPDDNQLTHIVQNAVSLFHEIFDNKHEPIISLISAGGDTNTKISPILNSWYTEHKKDFSTDTLRIEQLDVALDSNIRKEKRISGETANIIVVDNINTGNAILKSLSVLSNDWYAVGFLLGAKNTVILNSRSASEEALTENIFIACKK